jgi:hypothetical protein
MNGAGSFSSQIGNVNAAVPSVFLTGSISVNVPEPGSLALAMIAACAVLLCWRHSARRETAVALRRP